MKTKVSEISVMQYAMAGIPCQNCDSDTEWLVTTNDWKYFCKPCGVRFKVVTCDNDGLFTFEAGDGQRDTIFEGHRAFVAFDKEWPELETA
jgi:hypothetical protein